MRKTSIFLSGIFLLRPHPINSSGGEKRSHEFASHRPFYVFPHTRKKSFFSDSNVCVRTTHIRSTATYAQNASAQQQHLRQSQSSLAKIPIFLALYRNSIRHLCRKNWFRDSKKTDILFFFAPLNVTTNCRNIAFAPGGKFNSFSPSLHLFQWSIVHFPHFSGIKCRNVAPRNEQNVRKFSSQRTKCYFPLPLTAICTSKKQKNKNKKKYILLLHLHNCGNVNKIVPFPNTLKISRSVLL